MNDYLEIEVELLILKYGYAKVLSAIASRDNITLEVLEKKISDLKNKKSQKPRRKEVSVEEIVAKIISENPHIKDEIQLLLARFVNKTFLPELKDVRRFIEKQSNRKVNIKSRDSGAKHVFDIIKSMPKNEIMQVIDLNPIGESDYSLLSEQIIRSRK